MTKESKASLRAIVLIGAILLLVAGAVLCTGCRNLIIEEKIKVTVEENGKKTITETDKVTTDKSFDPKWSENKESIIKTGNIGISL